jgi:predicted RNase H-like HicB family nuclease
MNLGEVGGKVSKSIFQVTAQPDDGYLFLQFPGHPDIYTQARYFEEIEVMAKDAIFLMRDIPKNEIKLKIESPIPPDFPKTYFEFLRREFINKVRSFLRISALRTSPSADGK